MKLSRYLSLLLFVVFPAAAGPIMWTQSSESLTNGWTVKQQWDSRAETSTTSADKSEPVATPTGRTLRVTITPIPLDSDDIPTPGSATFTHTVPNAVLGLQFAPIGAAITQLRLTDDTNINLSTGSLDWVHWARSVVSDVNRKSGGNLISGVSLIGATGPDAGYPSTTTWPALSWSSGTPTASETESRAVYKLSGKTTGAGMQITAPSSSLAPRRLAWWVRCQTSTATVTATLGAESVTQPVCDNEYVEYQRIDIYMFGQGTMTAQFINTGATSTSIGIMGAALYE